MATGLGEENSKFKPVKIRLKINRILHLARAEGLANTLINATTEYLGMLLSPRVQKSL